MFRLIVKRDLHVFREIDFDVEAQENVHVKCRDLTEKDFKISFFFKFVSQNCFCREIRVIAWETIAVINYKGVFIFLM